MRAIEELRWDAPGKGGAEARLARIDWPTLALAVAIYGAFGLLTWLIVIAASFVAAAVISAEVGIRRGFVLEEPRR